MPLFKPKPSMKKPADDAKPQSLAIAYSVKRQNAKKMAEGGEVHASELMQDDERASSIADAIMKKREAKRFSDGGMVDLNENAEEGPADLDELNIEAAGKENYDDAQFKPAPMGSAQHGDDISSDKHDMISQIRAKIKAKRGM